MLKLRHTVFIKQPLPYVYQFVTRPYKGALWQSGIVEVTPQVPASLGQVYSITTENLGKRVTIEAEILEHETNKSFRMATISGELKFDSRYMFAEKDGGTEVTWHNDIEIGRIYSFAEPIVQLLGQGKLETDLKSLKTLLETAPADIMLL